MKNRKHTKAYHGLCVSTRYQSNWKGLILSHWSSESPERISMKLGYITTSWVWPHMKIHVALRQRGWLVWANTWQGHMWVS